MDHMKHLLSEFLMLNAAFLVFGLLRRETWLDLLTGVYCAILRSRWGISSNTTQPLPFTGCWVIFCLVSSSCLYSSCRFTIFIHMLRRWSLVIRSSPLGLGLTNPHFDADETFNFSTSPLQRWFKMSFVLPRGKRDLSCFWSFRGFNSIFFKKSAKAVVKLQGLLFSLTRLSDLPFPVSTSYSYFFQSWATIIFVTLPFQRVP